MNVLSKKRKEMGITQIQAANICGVSRRTYQMYEKDNHGLNKTYRGLVKKLNENDSILSIKFIRETSRSVFKRYKEVKCAYLYGSYARGEATSKSDVDIMLVCDVMGMDFFGMAVELEDALHKQLDLQTHRQIGDSAEFLEDILVEGIRIY